MFTQPQLLAPCSPVIQRASVPNRGGHHAGKKKQNGCLWDIRDFDSCTEPFFSEVVISDNTPSRAPSPLSDNLYMNNRIISPPFVPSVATSNPNKDGFLVLKVVENYR